MNKKLLQKIVALICTLFLLTGVSTADNGILFLPSGVLVIEEESFSGISATTVVIPKGTNEIGPRAFNPSDGLTDVYLPDEKLAIADDAFVPGADITFHVYLGSANIEWAQEHGYETQLITEAAPTPSSDAWKQVNDTISTEAVSALNDNLFGTSRLILKTTGDEIPSLDRYNPKKIIALGNHLHVIQFYNHNDAGACCEALRAWDGCQYVEADYFLSSTDSTGGDEVNSASINTDDPMGFQKYTEYLGDDVGHVKIAIIDSGVNANQVDCTVSSDSYDFITNQNKTTGFASMHGTNVAKKLVSCFGTLKNHLTILSYRVENPSNGAISYIQMGEALLQAREDGANFANISIAGESAYSDAQDNEFLRECINLFGSSRVIAAAGNFAVSAHRFIPGKYCISATGVSLVDGQLMRSSGTATNAVYGGFETTTSMAAPMVTAALALNYLDPDRTNTIDNALEPVATIQKGMPDLAKLAIKLVDEIVINDGYPIDTVYTPNEYDRIYYSVNPAGATVSTVTIASTNTSVLQVVSNNGNNVRIRTIGPGTAELVFTSDDGNAEKRVQIQVIQPPTSVTISGNTGEVLKQGQTMALTAEVLPANANDRTVTWSSSNNSIATVSDNGIVAQVGDGTVTITATANGDPIITDSISVTVSSEIPISGVTIAPAGGISTLYVGKTAGTVQMNAAVQPESASQEVTWASSDTSVATISDSGLVTARGRGTTTITAASVSGGAKGYYEINVIQLPVSLTISGATTVVEGNEIQLTGTLAPSNCNNTTINWSTSNTGIATVTTTGKVRGITAGSAVITASSAADGTVAATWTVTVQPATFTVTLNANGGSCSVSSFTATRNVKLGDSLKTPTRSYYAFDGWFTAIDGGSKVTADTVYSAANNITLYAHWTANPWSDWVLESQVPSGAATRASKTQYRYRDTYAQYSEWSAWSLWDTTAQTASDLKEVETATKRKWWAAQCKSCGRNNPYWGSDTKCKKCGKYMPSSNTKHVFYNTDDSSGSTIDGRANGRYYDGKPYWRTDDMRTCYRYRTRTVSYPWGNWTGWSDTYVSATDSRQVETRILVRYQNP